MSRKPTPGPYKEGSFSCPLRSSSVTKKAFLGTLSLKIPYRVGWIKSLATLIDAHPSFKYTPFPKYFKPKSCGFAVDIFQTRFILINENF